jgi:hypothetical protein
MEFLSSVGGNCPFPWLAESREVSMKHAYTREVLGLIEATMGTAAN